MVFWTIVRIAFKSLAANKLRSVLAMLGIIIGVWSVISALALAAGAQASVQSSISALGTNLLTITPGLRGRGGVRTGNQQNLKVDDALALTPLRHVDAVAPVVRGNAQVKYFNKNSPTTVLGTGPAYLGIHDYQIEFGRGFTDGDCDAESRVAIIGPTTAKNLFGSDYAWAIGEPIAVKGVSYKVIGITKAKGDQGWVNPDDQAIVPYTTAMSQIVGQLYLDEVDVSASSQDKLDDVEARITRLLRRRHHLADAASNDFDVFNQAEMLRAMGNINLILSLLLGGIAGISLLVGGIGVMNVMLVTVAERTREIGIRKAIGARRRDILRQFLIESVVMSATGGAIGVLAGYLTARIITVAQTSIQLLVTPSSVGLALGFSAAVGIFFGYYPARRAAKLDPIEALRYE